jgi:hypothetical protein
MMNFECTLRGLVFVFGLVSLSAFAAGGSFQTVGVSTAEFHSIEIEEGTLMSGHMKGGGTVINGGGLFESGMVSDTECLVSVKKHPKGNDISANCTVNYPDLGAKMFMLFERKAGDIAASDAKGGGTAIILGGSGQLQGISGECSYTIKYLDASRSVTNQDCHYDL